MSPEAMAAAGASNSVGSELMAGALARVRSAGGSVKPKGAPEKWADQYIRQTQGRDFNAFWNEVNQRFPGPKNSNARRKAGEYFGAFYYVFDAERQTLNAGTIAASPEVAVRDTPPVATAPPPASLPTPAVAPVAAEEVFEGRMNGAAVGPPPASQNEAWLRARTSEYLDAPAGVRGRQNVHGISDLAEMAGFGSDIPGFLEKYGPRGGAEEEEEEVVALNPSAVSQR